VLPNLGNLLHNGLVLVASTTTQTALASDRQASVFVLLYSSGNVDRRDFGLS